MTDDSHATIEDDHRQIRALLMDLGAAADLSRMLEVVDTLHPILVEHFQREEEPEGLYAEIRQLRPEFDGKLKALERQHALFLDMIRRLRSSISTVAEQLDRLSEVKSALIASVDEHEQTETNLMLDAYYLDLGDSG
jgi:hemerythrin